MNRYPLSPVVGSLRAQSLQRAGFNILLDVMCIFTGMLASTATALILLIEILCAIAGWLLMPRLLFAPLIRIGAPVCLSGLRHGSNLRLDQLLIAGLVPAATLGLYAVAVTWSGVLISVTSKIL